jgi:hypothetical protein
MPVFRDGVPYLTDTEFEDQFDPWMSDDPRDGTIQQIEWDELEELKYYVTDKQIWTAVETDNENLYLLPGIHHVNRQFFVITNKSWNLETLDVLWIDYAEFYDDVDCCVEEAAP